MSNRLRRGFRYHKHRFVRYIKHRFVRGALILVYHRISDSALDPWSLSVTPDHFAEHLTVLQRSFHPISLEDLAHSIRSGTKIRSGSVAVTFDDGYVDNLRSAQPLLERFDCPATVFLVTGAIGSPYEYWWDELASLLLQPHPLPEQLDLTIQGEEHSWQLGKSAEFSEADYLRYSGWRAGQASPSFRHELYLQLWKLIQPLSIEARGEVMNALRGWVANASPPARHRILTQKECVELAQSKQIELGAHTIHHPSLASLSCDAQREEIEGSKRDLEKILNQPVRSFTYPFGKRQDYSSETLALVQAAGFSVACCNEQGVVTNNTDPLQLPRIHVPDVDGTAFENRLLSKFHA